MSWFRREPPAEAESLLRELEQKILSLISSERSDLAVARARIVALEQENARLQAHFDWLAGHVNTITIERGALFDKVLQITWPAVPIIERQELPGADADYQPSRQGVKTRPDPQLGDILAKAREIARDVRRGTEPEVPYGIDFNDMGDEAAEKLGIYHAPDGTVR